MQSEYYANAEVKSKRVFKCRSDPVG